MACYNVGIHYLNGSDAANQDERKAVKWFQKAADKGIVPAAWSILRQLDSPKSSVPGQAFLKRGGAAAPHIHQG